MTPGSFGSAPPAPEADGPKKGKGKLVAAVVVAVVVVAALGLLAGAFVLTRGDDASSDIVRSSDGKNLPDGSGPTSSEPKSIWSVDGDCADGGCGTTTSGDRVMAQLTDDDGFRAVSLDPSSGKEQWSVHLDDDQYISWVGDTLVLNTSSCDDNGDCESAVAVLDPGSGDKRWSVKLEGNGYVFGGSVDGALLVSDHDVTKVTALSLDDGKEIWSKEGTFMALCDDRLYVDTSDYDENDDGSGKGGEMTALDVADGSTIWSTEIHGHLGATAACTDDGVAFDTYTAVEENDYDAVYSVTLLGGTEGGVLWSHEVDAVGQIEIADDTVLVVGTDKAVALAAADGNERWKTEIDTADDEPVTGVFDGRFLIAIGGDRAALLAPADGKEAASVDLDTGAAYLTTDSILLVTDDDVQAFATSDLAKQWTIDTDDQPRQAAVGAGRAFVFTDKGLEAFE